MMKKRLAWLGVIACSAVAAGVTHGQSEQPTQPKQTDRPATDDSERAGDLDFPGGTLTDYLAAVDKRFGKFNRVVEPEAASFRIEPVKFTSVRLREVILILRTMQDRETGARLSLHKVQGTEIWSISVNAPPTRSGGPYIPIELRVWSLRGLIDGGMRIEDILSAIETSVGLIGGEPKIRYHKDTGLLIVHGWPTHLDATNQVLNAIASGQHEARGAAARKEGEKGQPGDAN